MTCEPTVVVTQEGGTTVVCDGGERIVTVEERVSVVSVGIEGPKGEKGDTGVKGDTGSQGAMGPQGNPGPKGDTGDTGPRGPKGDTGLQGIPGNTGAAGAQGPTGPQGVKGDTGAAGPNIITSSTSTPFTGYLKGDGTAISATPTIPVADIAGLGTLATQSGTFSGVSSGTNTGDQITAGTPDRISVTNGGTNPVIDIDPNYAGQPSITTVGTITSGAWSAGVVTVTQNASNFTSPGVIVRNTSNGNTAQSYLQVFNDVGATPGTNGVIVGLNSSGYTNGANSGFLYNRQNGSMTIGTNNQAVQQWATSGEGSASRANSGVFVGQSWRNTSAGSGVATAIALYNDLGTIYASNGLAIQMNSSTASTPNAAYFYNRQNGPVVIGANNAEVVRFSPGGTQSASQNNSSIYYGATWQNTNGGTSSYTALNLYNNLGATAGTNGLFIGLASGGVTGNPANSAFFYNRQNGPIIFGTNNANSVTIAATKELICVSDIESTDSLKGLVLKSPNGTRWRVQATNAGALTQTSL